jgi:hypothetical protein
VTSRPAGYPARAGSWASLDPWSHVEEPGRADGVFFLPMARELSVHDADCIWSRAC